MSYQSIEAVQEALSNTTFAKRKDSRKAAGRALGTLLELITYYLLKDYGLLHNMCIERPLYEYANDEISHNVEFTLHDSKTITSFGYPDNASLTPARISASAHLNYGSSFVKKSNNPYKQGLLKNAATLYESSDTIVNAYADSATNTLTICELGTAPFAMFECKRVGIEKGMKKGPQTIEKAKQGAYVSRMVSRLQRFKRLDGSVAGVIEDESGNIEIGDYDEMLVKLISEGNAADLRDIVVTVGVTSDHGNWFTSEIQNKETRVLSQSYDWLLFLTDEGLTQFINDVLLGANAKMPETKKAFDACYDDNSTNKVSFTKTSLPAKADAELTQYFKSNRTEIANWFNVLTPANRTVRDLMNELKALTSVAWEEVEF